MKQALYRSGELLRRPKPSTTAKFFRLRRGLADEPLGDFMGQRESGAVAGEEDNQSYKRGRKEVPRVQPNWIKLGGFIPDKQARYAGPDGAGDEANRADGSGLDWNEARKFDERRGQVDSIAETGDGGIVGCEFGGLRPSAFEFGHARKRTKTEEEFLQVVTRLHVREFVLERDVQFVMVQQSDGRFRDQDARVADTNQRERGRRALGTIG